MSNPKDHPGKDACSFAVDLAKLFLTYAAAGLAFVLGLATKENAVSIATYSSFASLALSMGMGLLFIMSVVGRVGRDSNYDVYSGTPRVLAALQILLFLVGVALLALCAFHLIHRPPTGGGAVYF